MSLDRGNSSARSRASSEGWLRRAELACRQDQHLWLVFLDLFSQIAGHVLAQFFLRGRIGKAAIGAQHVDAARVAYRHVKPRVVLASGAAGKQHALVDQLVALVVQHLLQASRAAMLHTDMQVDPHQAAPLFNALSFGGLAFSTPTRATPAPGNH